MTLQIEMRVLVVDDSEGLARLITRLLRSFDVVSTMDARRVLEDVGRGERFGAILADVHMPNLSRLAMHEALSVIDAEQAVRVLFMTGGVTKEEQPACLRATGNPIVDKPFDPKVLRSVVASVASRPWALR